MTSEVSDDREPYLCRFCRTRGVVISRSDNGTTARCLECKRVWHYPGQLTDEIALLSFETHAKILERE